MMKMLQVGLLAAFLVTFAVAGAAFGQGRNLAANGVRHRLTASVALDGASPAIKENRDRLRAVLQMRLRISDHAIDSDFFGVVTVDFASSDLEHDTIVKTIWEDAKCHRDRGLPKVLMVDIHGTLAGPDKKFDIVALPRKIGKHVPDDEIIVHRIPPQPGRLGSLGEDIEISMEAQTKSSGIRIALNLTATLCALQN